MFLLPATPMLAYLCMRSRDYLAEISLGAGEAATMSVTPVGI